MSENSALNERQKSYLESVPVRFKAQMQATLRGDRGYAKAVKMKCCDCMGFEDTTNRVRHCTTSQCPLWQYRPYQQDGDAD
jgi:hypothetical protein